VDGAGGGPIKTMYGEYLLCAWMGQSYLLLYLAKSDLLKLVIYDAPA
jgi:hypothetical protein